MSRRSLRDRAVWLALSPAARPLRFVGTGGAAGAMQLILLGTLIHAGWNAIAANAIAFLLAAQINFVTSLTVTWRDRHAHDSLAQCWLLFHAAIAFMATVNMLTYIAARTLMPPLIASAAGIAVAAVGNYLAADRIVFSATPSGSLRAFHLG